MIVGQNPSPIKSVQRGATKQGNGSTYTDITISEVNPDKTILNYLGFESGTTATANYTGSIKLLNSTTVRLTAPQHTGASALHSWEVVEYV